MSNTLAIITAAVAAFGITAALGIVLIPWLRKLHFGQTILDIGPSWHKTKQGTPIMGGLLFIIGICVSFVLTAVTVSLTKGPSLEAASTVLPGSDIALLAGGIFLALGSAVIGFADDYIKAVKKQNLGLSAKQKTGAQLLVGIAYLITLYMSHNTWWYIPFLGKVDVAHVAFGIPFWILGLFIVYSAMNSVNLTDGVDGLCSSVTAVVALTFIIVGTLQKFLGLGILAASVLGGCLGFLVWNWNPAKIFMGDTGSLFLGGVVAAMAFAMKSPIMLLLIGIVYVCETMSDIIQIAYFKLTHGKRVFKMAPIHHHFELCGWKEKKICVVFSIVSLIGCTAAVLLIYFGECYS